MEWNNFLQWNGMRNGMWNGKEQTWVGMQSVVVSFPVHTHLLMISILEELIGTLLFKVLLKYLQISTVLHNLIIYSLQFGQVNSVVSDIDLLKLTHCG